MLAGLGLGGLAAAAPAWAAGTVRLPLPGGPEQRAVTTAFPGKGAMILQRTRPPLLETPFAVFDEGVFTPNDRFYVRWHWAEIPTAIDVPSFRLTVRGHVETALSLSLDALANMPRFEIAAVNQCSGNSRGLFVPRVPGAQWANGAMGNALWTGVRLKDVLDRAGVRGGAVQVRFAGLDEPVVSDAPHFRKSLALDHARDGEVMIAYAMNGAQLPLLNGFPLRLVVPGRYSTYWVKMLSDIEVLDRPDDQYWMETAYRIPDVPGANVRPGQTGFKTVPIDRMVPRAFVTNLQDGARVAAGAPVAVRGIAFGGDCGVRSVEISTDGGASWAPTRLGADAGAYSFRRFDVGLPALATGTRAVKVRCTNTNGLAQPMDPVWNGAGFMQNGVETVTLQVA
ncbi:molybdopterin-dependent oxidoreductase [Methylobacterium sp. yr668]|uniref:molybdopterin-dependent oxidoreductase n=1 Tax=Methylobacterium sp. yr668 TaxID=1761801 RepID=UPI000B86D02E|nr:molybdopterin-dependent oxidoreductase [Methylobacterium sp. yr668]